MVIVFDLNGTLLNTQALQSDIRKIFGSKLSAREWFHQLLEYAMASTLAGDYFPFDEIAVGVLQMEAAAHKLNLTSADIGRVQTRLKSLPPYPEVKRALKKLRQAHIPLAVLTNSTAQTMNQQLRAAGLDPYFDQALSVGELHRYKPSLQTYVFAARSLGVQTNEMLMVAAHPWDLLGATRAGCQTAFIQRTGKALFPNAPRPTYVGKDLADLATQIAPSSGGLAKPAFVMTSALLGFALTAGIASRRHTDQPSVR